MPRTAVYHNLKDAPKQCVIGIPVLLIRFLHLLLTVSQKAVTTKLKSLREMLTVTKILSVSETVFYIFFLTNTTITHKQPPVGSCFHTFFHFNFYANY